MGKGTATARVVVGREAWVGLAKAHVARVQQAMGGSTQCDPTHPVHNFLFQFYSLRQARLLKVPVWANHTRAREPCANRPGVFGLQWSAGLGVGLERGRGDCDDHLALLPLHFMREDTRQGVLFVDPSTASRGVVRTARRSLEDLEATQHNKPHFRCFGLHEWAMLYRPPGAPPPQSRYQQLPSRLSQQEINAVVESSSLRCTHFQAFRFFAPEAQPLNQPQHLNPTTSRLHDQSACLHANMDIFKCCVKLFPFVDSDTLAAAFELALECRVLDIRASPYDLRAASAARWAACLNLEPVCVETPEGKREYQREQVRLWGRAKRLRARVIEQHRGFLAECGE